MQYFTSDLHFGHDRQFIYKSRGFKSMEDHDSMIIARWNSVVTNNDSVFVLGDIGFGKDIAYIVDCIKQLNGTIYWILGNHDTKERQDAICQLDNVILLGYADVQIIDDWTFFLCHYKVDPIFPGIKKPINQCVISLHGHTHSTDKFESSILYQYNVGIDAHDGYPVSYTEIISDIMNKYRNF